jgi:hypothetical protein
LYQFLGYSQFVLPSSPKKLVFLGGHVLKKGACEGVKLFHLWFVDCVTIISFTVQKVILSKRVFHLLVIVNVESHTYVAMIDNFQ